MASKNEKEAAAKGMTLKEYKNSDEYKKKKKNKDKDKDSNSYKDIVDNILNATPAQQEILPSFEDIYSGNVLDDAGIERIKSLRPDVVAAFGDDKAKIQEWWKNYGMKEMPDEVARLEKEDYAQSEALYKPYFEQEISNELEDLNAWNESENISYDRSLRRARISLASQGGAIGEGETGERQTEERDMNADREAQRQGVLTGVERRIGTDRLTGAGFTSTGQNQEGSIVGTMKEAIQEGQLWYKNQRANRYYGNSNTYYQQPSAYSLAGNKL
jgi:hypothetical protein